MSVYHLGPTLTAVECDLDEAVTLVHADGRQQHIVFTKSYAAINSTTLTEVKQPQVHAHTVIRAHVQLSIDGVAIQLVRWVGNDRSFSDPYRHKGLNLWFDGSTDIFEHINENHGSCKPNKRIRFAVWAEGSRICPQLLAPWCPLPEDGLRISDCYDSDDCWMGPYHGADAHGGLDINHPSGTTLYTPLPIARHDWFAHLDRGDQNNRWRGYVDWPDGSSWILQSHHLIELLVPLHEPLAAGVPYATTAGMLTGLFEHSHFVFKVLAAGSDTEIAIDPWLLFRQMLIDRNGMIATRRNGAIERCDPPLS